MKNCSCNRRILSNTLMLGKNFYQNFCYRRTYVSSMLNQFKKEKTYFYPDRREETERMTEQAKGQLMADPNLSNNHKELPKDYYYQILGVAKDATTTQIKAAFHALAKRYHPDANKTGSNLSKRFQDIANAYKILVDEAKRHEYDKVGIEKERLQNNASEKMKSVRQQMVSGQLKSKNLTAISRPLPQPIPDVTCETVTPRVEKVSVVNNGGFLNMANVTPTLEISFLEAIHGIKKIIETKCFVKCPNCKGKSQQYVKRTQTEPCQNCKGTGKISKKTATYTAVNICDQCNGKRYVNRNHCDLCDSRGVVYETFKLPVTIPYGAQTGDVVVVHNPYEKQNTNYRIQVKESNYYTRIGYNIFSDKYITVTQAILGGTFKVRGAYGDIEIKVEPGTESHTQFRIPGKGVRHGDSYGDHIITVKVLIPKQLNMKQRQLILTLAKSEDPIFEPST